MAAPKLQMEYAVQMTCGECEKQIKTALNVEGVDNVFVDVANELVLVDTSLPSNQITRLLRDTGKLVVFRGIGGGGVASTDTTATQHRGAAVAIMKGMGGVKGMARLVQISDNECVVDGTIDGLVPGHTHLVQVHEYGDLSSGCDNCGDVLGGMRSSYERGRMEKSVPAATGFICSVESDELGRAVFQTVSDRINVMDIIGRSMVITNTTQTVQNRIMCGIIARSAGLFQNTKKVCTCDGVTIWDEAKKNIKT